MQQAAAGQPLPLAPLKPLPRSLFMLCVAWVVTTGMALYAIRERRIEQHREWMLRSYTVTFAFVTYRKVRQRSRIFLWTSPRSPERRRFPYSRRQESGWHWMRLLLEEPVPSGQPRVAQPR
jgi:Predicted membrane protein (DUF2306)